MNMSLEIAAFWCRPHSVRVVGWLHMYHFHLVDLITLWIMQVGSTRWSQHTLLWVHLPLKYGNISRDHVGCFLKWHERMGLILGILSMEYTWQAFYMFNLFLRLVYIWRCSLFHRRSLNYVQILDRLIQYGTVNLTIRYRLFLFIFHKHGIRVGAWISHVCTQRIGVFITNAFSIICDFSERPRWLGWK